LLIEREKQLSLLESLTESVRRGRGQIALVSGEAGIGKSTLVRKLRDIVPPDWRCGIGGCDALFTPRPLGPVQDMASVLGPEVERLIRQGADRAALDAALLDALNDGQGPFLLVWEDLHWADFATLDLLRYLGRRIAFLPVMLVVTFRPGEPGADDALQGAIADLPSGNVTELALAPLTARAVGALAREAGQPGDWLFRATEGNPFRVSEMLAAQAGRSAAPPGSVREAVIARQAGLDPEAREFLEVISVIPAAVPAPLVHELVPDTARQLIEDLTGQAILQASPAGDLRFRHEIARLATFDRIPAARKRVHHARILDALRPGSDRQAFCDCGGPA
jgi:predicted ATPase